MNEDNPRKPYKAVAAFVVAEATYLVGQQMYEFPLWVMLLLNMVLVGGVTFGIRNPKVGE